ncbi:MAG: arsenical pump-driving ATPase [Planctomycetota bacterium]
MTTLPEFLAHPPRHLFFTGKGGVGKTSVACATALALANAGKRVLLVSTDPASNLDEVLATPLASAPRAIAGAPGLMAQNLDPNAAAHAYRERMVAPFRSVLPAAAVRSIEEQMSGACTVEIAAFDEFAKLLGDPATTTAFDHVVFDTAPTGHTLRLLELPAAWSEFLAESTRGTSCLGPLSGLAANRALYASTHAALADGARTAVVLVARADRRALAEAERTRGELGTVGVHHLHLVLNGVFRALDRGDPIAMAMQRQNEAALAQLPAGLAPLPRTLLPLLPFDLVGLDALRALLVPTNDAAAPPTRGPAAVNAADPTPPVAAHGDLASLLPDLAARGHGVIMTMGKGGVGTTTVAAAIAVARLPRGHRVHLTTTDPAAHVVDALGGDARSEGAAGLRVSRIDPVAETAAYRDEVLAAASGLDAAGRALLAEDLRSPCTEEIAVFRAFARVVHEGEGGFVVVDTAPTGHTLLLLDAADAYHREVLRSRGAVPDEVRALAAHLRDPEFTRMLLVTLPEATPVHEAAALQQDLARAGIRPFAWVINQSLLPLAVTDPLLVRRRANEPRFHAEVAALSPRVAVVPWSAPANAQQELAATLAVATTA